MTIDLRLNYSDLRKINVNKHTEQKGAKGSKLTYLSWAWAVHYLLEADPAANWEYKEPVKFGETLMVFCSVTACGKTMTSQLPVLDYHNKAIKNPTSMDVNTAMQRCLVKAIALHGIALYVYSGEDLPITDTFVESLDGTAAEDIPPIYTGDDEQIIEAVEKISEATDVPTLKTEYLAAVEKADNNQETLKFIIEAKKRRYRQLTVAEVPQ